MDTIKELYKVGNGPSSSHTMGPKRAAEKFLNKNPDADKYVVQLFGSLALTGRGHLTDYIIKSVFGEDRCEIVFHPELFYEYHSNGMKFFAYKGEEILDEWLVFSVGGGSLKELNEERRSSHKSYYPLHSMNEILKYVNEKKITLVDFIFECEDDDILEYAYMILDVMFKAVERGLNAEGLLPGPLKVKRRAKTLYEKYLVSKDLSALVFACSLAVSEENASGGEIVTSPTCGSSGVVPGVLYAYYKTENYPLESVAKALLVGGLFGNLVKHNASISGAEVGCQGEIGTACSMAAAALTYLKGGTSQQIEYAAEIALEHHLGMTCDPVLGYVQIPCIERNAISSRRAIDSSYYALLTDGEHYIDFDTVVVSLKETGCDLHAKYRETSLGGLATAKKNL